VADEHDDLSVIGSGPGGASLAHRLAPSSKKILILERGAYLPRETQNWLSSAVFVHGATRHARPGTPPLA
jgi:choline dehydrogenase-like flavoprotein